MAYRLVVIDEILPDGMELTAEKLRLIWASRVRCRRLEGFMSPAGGFAYQEQERVFIRPYCEMRNYDGKGPGELVLEAVKPWRYCLAKYVKYRVRRPLINDCIMVSPSFDSAVRLFLETIRDFHGFKVAGV